MKKKVFSLFSILIILSYFCFSKSFNGESSVEVFTTVENISESEKNWLGSAVEEKLEANLSKYTNLKIVNNANKNQILQIQKKSESAAFDEQSIIEAGKLTTAQYGLFLTVRKAGSSYTVSIRFTNLTTGESLATVVSQGKKDVESLYSFNGCAVDEVTIELCDQLEISLSPAERHIILNGESGLSIEEKNKLYQADVELYSQKIKDIDLEIHKLSISSDLDAAFRQDQLEAEKSLAEEKLKLVREKQRRAEEEYKNRKADELKNAERTAEQKARIDAMSKELNSKLEYVRQSKIEQESILGQIKIIELKKKALVEIKQKIDFEKQLILQNADKIIQAKTEEINNRKPRTVETDGKGNLTQSAKENREREITAEKEKELKNAYENIKQIKEKIDEQNHQLLEDVYDDYKKLGNKTVNTLGQELVVDYGHYDGNKDGWPLYITVKSDDVIIFQTTSFLSYEELTGKQPVKDYTHSDFEDFANEVDLFESLFLRGEPILTYELDYSVKPMSLNYPSQYKFYFTTLRYFDTRSMVVRGHSLKSKKCGILFLENDSIVRQMLPAYDLRGFESIASLDYEVTVPDIDTNPRPNRKDDDFLKNLEKDLKENYSDPLDNYYDSDDSSDYNEDSDYDYDYEDNNNSSDYTTFFEPVKKRNGRTLIGITYGFMGLQMPGSAVQFDFSSAINKYMFLGFNLDILIPEVKNKTLYDFDNNSSVVLNFGFNFGTNYKFNFIFFKPNFFGTFGLGANYFSNEKTKEDCLDFVIALDFGADLPIGDTFNFIVSYGFDCVIGKGIYDKLSLGCGFLLDN